MRTHSVRAPQTTIRCSARQFHSRLSFLSFFFSSHPILTVPPECAVDLLTARQRQWSVVHTHTPAGFSQFPDSDPIVMESMKTT